MGAKNSRDWNSYAPPQPSYAPMQQQSFGSSQSHNPPQQAFGRRYSNIADNYSSLKEVTEALARAGLESANLIIAVDFTKSNESTGANSFNGKSLHHIGENMNPYEQAISIIDKTLSPFYKDNLIPCFGFGDASTHDHDVFSLNPDKRFCNGSEEVLSRYRDIVPRLRLAGPTSFAPVIEMAMTVVEQSGGQYHVLLIIADGPVMKSLDTSQLSPLEQKNVQAIFEASNFPLSIILVGVGDGRWNRMKEFDDNIPVRAFNNFQFVNFTEIMAKNVTQTRKETEFALSALMEIPSQYKATIELKILGRRCGKSPQRVPLPPPRDDSKPSHFSSFKARSVPHYLEKFAPTSSAPPSASSSTRDNYVCFICLINPKDMAFGCGHQTCRECGEDLHMCPIFPPHDDGVQARAADFGARLGEIVDFGAEGVGEGSDGGDGGEGVVGVRYHDGEDLGGALKAVELAVEVGGNRSITTNHAPLSLAATRNRRRSPQTLAK